MRKLLCGAVAVAAYVAGSPAIAADMPVKAPYVAPRAVCEYGRFDGKYVGANVGWSYYDSRWSDRDGWHGVASTILPGYVNGTDNGWNAGVSAGWNWQKGCTLWGVEVDWSWSNLKRSTYNTDGEFGIDADSLRVNSQLNWFGTARTRTGVIVDNLVLYITGGFAFARIQGSWTLTNNSPPAFTETFSSSDTRWGWTAGFGAEYAWTPRISIKSEVLYMNFGRNESTFTTLHFDNVNFTSRRFEVYDSMWVSRIGLNFKFGDAVYAKY